MSVYYKWDKEKNSALKKVRGVSFEQVVMYIEKGHILDVVQHPNQKKYAGQCILIIQMNQYVYLVPFVKENENIFVLKTIIPSRKATKKYLGGKV